MRRRTAERALRGRGGFTLLEVLIAFAILSVILAALYSTFFLAHRAVEGLDSSLLRMHELRSAFDMMQREMEAALPGGEHPVVVRDRDIFGRQASQVTLTTAASTAPGAVTVSYYVEEAEGGGLVLLKRLDPAYGEARAGGMEAPVLEDIEGFTVEVLRGTAWARTWDGGLPEEMRVTLTIRIKDKEFSMSETIRPKVGSRA
ncbi:MAG: type II secretion system protein GspJ [Thermodesulfovibrionales bacterium]